MKKLLLSLLFVGLLVGSAGATDYTADANCVAAYLFTEGSGTTVDDASANSNTGNFASSGHPSWAAMSGTNAPTYADYMVNFDGTNDYIKITNFPTYHPISVVLWENPDALGGEQTLFRWQVSYLNIINSNSNVRFEIKTSAGTRDSFSTTNMSAGTWYHIACVFDESINQIVYINGVAEVTADRTGETAGYEVSGDCYFGSWGGTEGFLDGSMSETAPFSRTLTSTEINDIMDNGLAGSAEPPAGVIKSIWGINLSDIKKINGIDIGDIKQINGLTTQ